MTRNIIFSESSAIGRLKTYTATVFFNKGELTDVNNVYLKEGDTYHKPMASVFGHKHEDGSIWFVSLAITTHFNAPGTRTFSVEVIDNNSVTNPVIHSYEYDFGLLTGLNNLKIVPVFKPSNEVMEEKDYISLIDPKYALTPFPLEMAGKRVSVYSGIVNHCRFELTLEAPSREPGLRYTLQILNDETKTTPGELVGDFKIMFVGGFAGIYNQSAYGVTTEFFTVIGETPITTFNIPLGKLGVTQSWMCGGVIRFDSYNSLYEDIASLNVGFMTRETLEKVEMPEYQLPTYSEEYKQRLLSESNAKYNTYLTAKLSCWDALGQSKTPPMSGFQPQFGNFPTDARAVLETSSQNALMNLLIQEMRVMSARPGWINGLYYVDAGDRNNPDRRSTYTWTDIPHNTSLNRWGLERNISMGTRNGWEGQDAEHYGMTPAFWLAMLTGSYALINLFEKRAIMAQCHWHSAYYFGSWTDVLRSEGRLGRVLTQAVLLTGDASNSFKTSLRNRLAKILREFKESNTYVVSGNISEYAFYTSHGSYKAPYGNVGSRQRPDIRCDGYPTWNNPQSVVCWQMGMLQTAFWKLYKKCGMLDAKTIVKDMFTMFVNNAFILDASEGPVTGMKKYYAADNPRGYQTIGWSMDALTQWPMCLLTAVPNEVYDECDQATKDRFNKVNTAMSNQWPKLNETPWCAEQL